MSNALSRGGQTTRNTIISIVDELKKFASRRGDDIIMNVMPRWVSLRSKKAKRVFAELRPSKNRIQVFILPSPQEIGNHHFIDKAPSSQGWDWFKSKFYIECNGRNRIAIRLLRLAYLDSLRPRRKHAK